MPLVLPLLAVFAIVLIVGTRASESAFRVRDSRREHAPRQVGEDMARDTGARLEDAEIASAEGFRLRGWYFEPPRPNGAAILLIHGFTDTRAYMIEHARLFLRHGYRALLIDSRGHGDSEGGVVSFGVRESHDVRLWGDWLCQRTGGGRFFVFGQSMGAAIAVQSLAVDARIAGEVVEACFTRFSQAAIRRLVDRHFFGWTPARALFRPVLEYGYLYGRLRYRVDMRQAAPEDVLARAATPVLLIHGTADRTIPSDAIRALHACNPRWTLAWEVEGAGHTECLPRAGAEYERRVIGFLTSLRDESRESAPARDWRPAR